MKIKNEILLAGIALTLVLSLYNLNSISSLKDDLSKNNDKITQNLLKTINDLNVNQNTKKILRESVSNGSEKKYISPAPKPENKSKKDIISTKLNNTQKNMMNNPMTPQMNNNSGTTTIMSFNEDVFDFGKVDIETENKHSFIFTNNGKEPLQITNAKGSCGCTVPDWPKEAIMPNESGEIVVIYRPTKGQAGSQQTKTVTVTANTEPAHTTLNIKASVNPVSE